LLNDTPEYNGAAETNEIVTISYTYNDQGYRTSKTIKAFDYIDNNLEELSSRIINYHLQGNKVIFETDGDYWTVLKIFTNKDVKYIINIG
jgi:YD repeat-containing protein